MREEDATPAHLTCLVMGRRSRHLEPHFIFDGLRKFLQNAIVLQQKGFDAGKTLLIFAIHFSHTRVNLPRMCHEGSLSLSQYGKTLFMAA